MRENVLWNSGSTFRGTNWAWKVYIAQTTLIKQSASCLRQTSLLLSKWSKKKKWFENGLHVKMKNLTFWDTGIPRMEIIPFLSPSTSQLLAYYNGTCSFVLEKWGINGKCLPCLAARGLGLPPMSSQQPARCHFTLWRQDYGLDTLQGCWHLSSLSCSAHV